MPVPAVIAAAAENYRFNSDSLVKMVSDLSPEEWLSRPSEKTNHIAWIVGHVIWTRKQLLGRLGTEWSQPWLGSFARGAKCGDGAPYPSLRCAARCMARGLRLLAGALGNVSEEALSQPATKGPPAPTARSAASSTSSPSTKPTMWVRRRICAAGWGTRD